MMHGETYFSIKGHIQFRNIEFYSTEKCLGPGIASDTHGRVYAKRIVWMFSFSLHGRRKTFMENGSSDSFDCSISTVTLPYV